MKKDKSKKLRNLSLCMNPSVSAEVKQLCNGQLPRYKTEDIERKLYYYLPQVQKTVLGTPKSNDSDYLKRGTE